MTITLMSILYGIFVLEEVGPRVSVNEKNEIENCGFKTANNDAAAEVQGSPIECDTKSAPEKKRKCSFLDFFNPIVVVQYIKLITRKREMRGRAGILLLLIISSFNATFFIDNQYDYIYTHINFKWSTSMQSYSSLFENFTMLIGSYMMILIVGKKLGVPDVMLAVLGLIPSLIARAICVSELLLS